MSDITRGIIAVEEPQQCDYCGKVDELRPYGRDSAVICFDCAMKPENKGETERQFAQLLAKFTGAAQ